jgi:hypothetical protein
MWQSASTIYATVCPVLFEVAYLTIFFFLMFHSIVCICTVGRFVIVILTEHISKPLQVHKFKYSENLLTQYGVMW